MSQQQIAPVLNWNVDTYTALLDLVVKETGGRFYSDSKMYIQTHGRELCENLLDLSWLCISM